MKWRTVPVFISSTFADMHSERDYLKRFVFPALNEELKKYGVQLRVVDLRWGINTLSEPQDTVEEKVMRVCLEEIDRSRPFFIGLLGNRYGWIPPVFTKKTQYNGKFDGCSITSIEIEYGILQQQKVVGCLVMERQSSCLADIADEIRERYDDAYSSDETIRTTYPHKLNELKKKIFKFLQDNGKGDSYETYCPKWNGKGFDNLEEFGAKVKKIMYRELQQQFPLENLQQPFYEEDKKQSEFVFKKSYSFYNRTAVTSDLIEKIRSVNGVLAITGISGSGKSCIYAYLVKYFCELSDNYIVLNHTTATGADSRNVQYMIERWNDQIENILQIQHVKTNSIQDAMLYFKNLIKICPKNKKVLLFVDAVNGFYKNQIAEYLSFYPRMIIPNCLMISTSLPENLNKLRDYHHNVVEYKLPSVDRKDALGIIDTYAKFVGKELYPEIIGELLKCECQDIPCYSSPLWLNIALMRLMEMSEDDFYQISLSEKGFNQGFVEYIREKIASFSQKDSELFKDFLYSLDSVYNHIPIKLFKVLSISYNGLDEDVIAYLIGKEWNPLKFAIIRNFFRGLVTEQGSQKSWQILHDICKLQLSEYEKQQISWKIADYYINRINAHEVVNDNITHYLVMADDDELTTRFYLHFNKLEKRIISELLQVCERDGCSEILDFIFRSYELLIHKTIWILLPMRLFELKEIVVQVANYLNKSNKHKEALALTESFFEFIQKSDVNKDLKSLLCILAEPQHERAVEYICSKTQQKKSYINAMKRATVSGPLSLIIAPIACKYYQWKLFKI